MTATVAANRGGQIRDHVELLELTRARHRQQPGDGEFTFGAPVAKHNFPPLHGRPKGSLRGIVCGVDPRFVHERKEVGMVEEQGAREIRHVGVRGVDVAFRQREELLLDRQGLRDQVHAR